MAANATGSGCLRATPSMNVGALLVLMTSPAFKERAYAGAAHHADDLGAQSESIAHRHQARNTQTHTDGHKHRIVFACRVKKLSRISSHARDQVGVKRRHGLVTAPARQLRAVFTRLLKICAMNHQLGAEARHGCVLPHAIAMHYHNHHRYAAWRPA